MEEMNTSISRKAIHGLAVAGFISLVAAGMWLAVYSTRFVPTIVNRAGATVVYLGSVAGRIGSAAVSLGSIFNRAPISSTTSSVASSTVYFGNEATSSSNSVPIATPAPVLPSQPTAGPETNNIYQISGSGSPVSLYGLPDLSVQITAVGYLTGPTADSFVASTTIPVGSRPIVKFTIKNIGTNVANLWRFSASIPTQSLYLYESQPQQSLNPSDSIDYTLGFDQANRGINQKISVSVNFDNTVVESDKSNNTASTSVTILGS